VTVAYEAEESNDRTHVRCYEAEAPPDAPLAYC